MKPHVRRAIAFIAGSIISKNRSNSIFDYSASQHFNFSINLSSSGVAAYDYTMGCHISGSYSSLFHYGEGNHISLRIDGDRFSGFDYGEGAHFSGNVNGHSISLFDYGVGSYFNYSI